MQDRLPRKLAAILYADVAGYSRLTGEDEDSTHRKLSEYLDLVSAAIGEHHGRVVHYAGDAVLADFGTATDATSCATFIQRELETRNRDLPDARKVQFRIGVNLGEVIVDRDDIYGDGVNVAARLESLADPGGICVSDSVRTAIGKKLDLGYQFMGEHSVKNIDEPVRPYRVLMEGSEGASATSTSEPALELPDKPSLAVLPFANMSGDPEQEYFSDGISEDIITDMSQLSDLFVIARNSSFAYRDRNVNLQEVSRDLGVRYVLHGSVRKSGDRVRVTAELVDCKSGHQSWAERYDRNLDDIFALQDELSRMVVAAIAVRLTESDSQRLGRRPTDSVEAYDCLLRSREQLLLHTRGSNASAITLLSKALELDPGCAPAYVHLAEAHLQQLQLGWSDSAEEALERALEYADRAVAIDDQLGSGHGVRGQVFLWQKRYDEAIAEGERRVALDPSDAEGIGTLAMTHVFSGSAERTLELMASAMRLDPHYPFWHLHVIGMAHMALEDYTQAIAALKRAIVRNPDSMPPHMVLAACLALVGDQKEAEAELAESKRLNPDLSLKFAAEQIPYRLPRDRERNLEGLRKAGLK